MQTMSHWPALMVGVHKAIHQRRKDNVYLQAPVIRIFETMSSSIRGNCMHIYLIMHHVFFKLRLNFLFVDFKIIDTSHDIQPEFEDGTTRPIFKRKLKKTVVSGRKSYIAVYDWI